LGRHLVEVFWPTALPSPGKLGRWPAEHVQGLVVSDERGASGGRREKTQRGESRSLQPPLLVEQPPEQLLLSCCWTAEVETDQRTWPWKMWSRRRGLLLDSVESWWDGCIPDTSSGCSAPTFSPLSREAQAAPPAAGRSASSRFAPALLPLQAFSGSPEGHLMPASKVLSQRPPSQSPPTGRASSSAAQQGWRDKHFGSWLRAELLAAP